MRVAGCFGEAGGGWGCVSVGDGGWIGGRGS